MTLIKEKYQYKNLRRTHSNKKRSYISPDNQILVSVTTILDSTKDKSGLMEWRKRIGENRANEIVREAANVGTRMHRYLEDYILTGVWSEPGSNLVSQKSHKMAAVILKQALANVDEIWGSEVPLYVPNLYAGTTDLVGVYKGHDAIMDFKQSNRLKKAEWIEDYYLQLALYIEAHNDMFGTDIRHGHVFMCTKELEYQQFDLTPEPDPHFGRTFNDWRRIALDRVYQYYEKHGTDQ